MDKRINFRASLRPLLDGEKLIKQRAEIMRMSMLTLIWKLYSGLSVLLKQKWVISRAEQRSISNAAFAAFVAIIQHPVLTHV